MFHARSTGATVLNNPSPGKSGLLMTFAFSPMSRHALVQHHYALEGTGKIAMYYRYSYKQDSNVINWTPWHKVAVTDGSAAFGNYGKLTTGTDLDSILSNSVYLLGTSGSYGHDPLNGAAGFLTTKTVGLVSLQIAEGLSGARLTRYTADGGDTWSSWV